MENNDHQKDAKLRGDRTQHSGILKTLEDQTTEYIQKNQRLVNNGSDKTLNTINSWLKAYFTNFK